MGVALLGVGVLEPVAQFTSGFARSDFHYMQKSIGSEIFCVRCPVSSHKTCSLWISVFKFLWPRNSVIEINNTTRFVRLPLLQNSKHNSIRKFGRICND